jgi:ribosomal protein L37AE/L43A
MPKKKRKSYGLRGRGGASLRKRYGRIMASLKTYHKCPSCASPSVKRVSVGIWNWLISHQQNSDKQASGFVANPKTRFALVCPIIKLKEFSLKFLLKQVQNYKTS